MRAALGGLLLAALAARGARAQATRPSEEELFGAPAKPQPEETPPPGQPPAASPEAPSPAPTPPPGTPESARDEALLGAPDAATRLSAEAAPEDPLRIGGMFYLQTQTSGLQGDAPDDWALSSPTLMDVYMDARPNERVRGLILGRLFFDPTLPREPMAPMLPGPENPGATVGSVPLNSLLVPRTRGPHAALDQMWLRFDLARRVFVTAGRQHERWGTGRFWTPTDFLHLLKRSPLDVFDARVGTNMLKLHVPWEARGWNFYAYAVNESVGATPEVGDVAGAGRAQVVFGTVEVAAGALVKRHNKPRIAFDFSAGVWDLDLYGELALRYGSEIDRVSFVPNATPPGPMPSLQAIVDAQYPASRDPGIKPQAVGGLTYSRKYDDDDVFNVGLEYFYNALGYDDPDVYPGLILPRTTPLADPATFFYLGRQYGAVFLNFPAPYSWDYTTFTLSTLGNLSDLSFITRLDFAQLFLTHLRFEAFAAVRYGKQDGEFRFGVKDLQLGGLTFSRPPALIDLGVALRVSL